MHVYANRGHFHFELLATSITIIIMRRKRRRIKHHFGIRIQCHTHICTYWNDNKKNRMKRKGKKSAGNAIVDNAFFFVECWVSGVAAPYDCSHRSKTFASEAVHHRLSFFVESWLHNEHTLDVIGRRNKKKWMATPNGRFVQVLTKCLGFLLSTELNSVSPLLQDAVLLCASLLFSSRNI